MLQIAHEHAIAASTQLRSQNREMAALLEQLQAVPYLEKLPAAPRYAQLEAP